MDNLRNGKQAQIDHLNHEVVILYNQGKYDEAMDIATQAYDFALRSFGTEDPNFATCQDNLALLYKVMGNYSCAEKLMNKALEIRRKALGESNPDFVTSLNNLAGLYKTMGLYTQAEPLYLKAIDIISKEVGENNEYFTGSLNNLASLYKSMGNYNAAEPLYCKTKEIWSRIKGETDPNFAIFLSNLADLYYMVGRYSEAKQLYLQALEITRTTLGEEHPQFAHSLNNIGSLFEAMGYYSDAESSYSRACKILCKVFGEDHPELAASQNNLAQLYKLMGNYDAAERLYHKANEIWRATFGEEHPNFVTGLNNLADLYYWRGNFSAGEPLYQQALEILRRTQRGNHPDAANILNNLAVLYKTEGKYVEARSNYCQAMEIWLKLTGEKNVNIALCLHNLGAMYHAMGEYKEAESNYNRALEIRREILGEEHPDIAISLNSLAALYVATSRQDEAITLMKQAVVIDDHIVGQIFSISSESQRMKYLKTLRGNFYGFLSMILGYPDHSSSVKAGLDLTLRRKAIGAEALAVQRDAVLGGKYPDLASKLKELSMMRKQIAKKTLEGPEMEDPQFHQRLLDEWNVQKEHLETDLVHRIPEMNLELKLRAANLQSIAIALPSDSALVEFVRFDIFDFKALPAHGESQWKPAHYLAFVLPANEPENVKMVDLGDSGEIDRKIALFRTYVTGVAKDRNFLSTHVTRDKAALKSYGNEVRKAIFDPLINALGGRNRLFIAPDGDLSILPFEALPIRDGHYIIDEYHISYLSVGRDTLRLRVASSSQPAKPLVVADPDFDFGLNANGMLSQPNAIKAFGRQSHDLNHASVHFDRLPGTRIEGEEIADMMGVELLLGDEALETRLKAYLSPLILHIATHGFFLPDQHISNKAGMIEVPERFLGAGAENPLLRSGLVLSGANTRLKGYMPPPEAEDGFLNAEDVSGLDLLNTELVVLSACETGLGQIQVGEGVFGLRRAFMMAGAKTLVMSLWKVPDQQTQELMVDFYHRILNGQLRADALRKARLVIKEKYPDPYYWGAFICEGDPGPLPSNLLSSKDTQSSR